MAEDPDPDAIQMEVWPTPEEEGVWEATARRGGLEGWGWDGTPQGAAQGALTMLLDDPGLDCSEKFAFDQVDASVRLLAALESKLSTIVAHYDAVDEDAVDGDAAGVAFFRTRRVLQVVEEARGALERVAPDVEQVRTLWTALQGKGPDQVAAAEKLVAAWKDGSVG